MKKHLIFGFFDTANLILLITLSDKKYRMVPFKITLKLHTIMKSEASFKVFTEFSKLKIFLLLIVVVPLLF
jgi:hypothetical protein